MIPQRFDTARMAAERALESDLADLVRMHCDPLVMATLGGVRSESETRRALSAMLEHWNAHGYGIWIFRERGSGAFAGRAGLRNVTIEGRGEIELLYAVMPEFWRSGYGTEIARALLGIARDAGIKEVVAFTLPANLGSRRVMEKAGMRFEREITWAGLPHVLYRIDLYRGGA